MNKIVKLMTAFAFAAIAHTLFAYNGGYENSSLTDITIGGVTYKGYGNNTVTAREESGTTIAANRYAQCKALKSVDLTGVTSIGDAAFAYSALESVDLTGVTSMGYIAFGGCPNLSSVAVGNWSWYAAGKEPFRDCANLKALSVNGAAANPPAFDLLSVFSAVTEVRCPAGTEAAWRAAYPKLTVTPVLPMYAIAYDFDGGTMAEGTPASAGENEWFVLPSPVKADHVFGGWVAVSGLDPTCASVSVDGLVAYPWNPPDAVVGAQLDAFIACNLARAGQTVTLKALWIRRGYTIAYDLGGGAFDPGLEGPTFVKENEWAVMPSPTRAHCTFGGWQAVSGLDSTCAAVSVDGVQAYQWWPSDAVVAAGIDAFIFQNLTRIGYTVTLKALWIPENGYYAIDYDLDGGTPAEGAPTAAAQGEWLVLPMPTKPGFTFGGWQAVSGLDSTCAVCSVDGSVVYQWWPSDAVVGAGLDWVIASDLTRAGYTVTLKALWMAE